jgi:integrase/recombinase XerD
MIFNKTKFKKKLQMKGYANSSIQSYIRRLELYEQWLKLKITKGNESDTNLAFSYLKHLQKQSNNYRTINRELQPLKLYYKFFRKSNPFQYIYIKKVEEKIKPNFFTKEELEEIYNNLPQNTISQIRDKILIGFYVFQGVKSSEAKTVDLKDIDLNGYKILLKGDKRTDPRKISLNIKQILLLSEYINNHRNKIINKITSPLFNTSSSEFALQNLLQRLSEKLRKSVYGFEALYQLRSSVIYNWVKEYDLRKAQYLSGHKYISTTEKFIVKDLSILQKEVDKYFPL